MKKIISNSLIIFSTLLLNSCGGGGGSSSGDGQSAITRIENIQPILSTNYSYYAWNINPNISNSLKTTYNINDNAHINLPLNTNKTKIKVAVIDKNFQVEHPDIKDKVIATYNAMDGTSNVLGNLNSFAHGTAVAGVIASTYLGVAPNNVELILINIDLENLVSDINLLLAFSKAEELGAKVINCSWGGTGLSQILESKIQKLKDKGIVVVFASGNGDKFNNGIDLDLDGNEDESESEFVLGVGATSVFNDVTSYSNYGSAIDILAPGGDSNLGILSLDLLKENGGNYTLNGLVNNNYSFTNGTSFAAPTITGVIALMLSENPNLNFDKIRNILISNTEHVGLQNGANYSINNFDKKRAYGKVNASAAVNAAINAN